MDIERIDDPTAFKELETSWEQVYAADEHAQPFLSWSWISAWFEVAPHAMFVLAARPDSQSPYVAFLLLGVRRSGMLHGLLRHERSERFMRTCNCAELHEG